MAYRRRPVRGTLLLLVLLTGTTTLPVLHDAVTAHPERVGAESPTRVVAPCPVCDGHLAPAFPSPPHLATWERPLVLVPEVPEPGRLHEPVHRAPYRARAPPPSS